MKINVTTEKLFAVTIGDTTQHLTRQEAEQLYSLLGNSFGAIKAPVPTPLGPPYTKPFPDYPLFPNEYGPAWGGIISHPNRPGYTITGSSGAGSPGKFEMQSDKGTGKQ